MTIQDRLLSPLLHLILYGALLVATPFIMLQNFLQEAIGSISEIIFHVGSIKVVVLPCTMGLFLLIVFLLTFRNLNFFRVGVLIFILLMIALAQQLTDFYFHHNFYDLQQNWHYYAYSIFAWLMYLYLVKREMPVSRMMLWTFFIALFLSSFDEFFQLHMSNRVFDISDIAKDAWGVLIGMAFVYFVLGDGRALLRQGRLRHRRLSGYLGNPIATFVLVLLLGLLLLIISSLLTEVEYGWVSTGITIAVFLFCWLLIHLSQFRWIGPVVYILVIGSLLTEITLFYTSEPRVTHNSYGLTIYRGVPIPFFDIMIFPDGGFRLVDKKHMFNVRDRQTLLLQEADIIVIGSGTRGKGGLGFPRNHAHQFLWNPFAQQGVQLLILPNQNAVQVFNQLKKDGKNVLFVLHNTC